MITELRYSSTNTYLVQGSKATLLFDTGWAGTLPAFFKALGEKDLKVQDIDYILISHFHPDHMGIAQQIADMGATIVIADVQRDFVHFSDNIFDKDKQLKFVTINDEKLKVISINQSREFLKSCGIYGELIHTPGHSDDSISLWLDSEKALLVGDLNPLYELELHKGTQIEESWSRLLKLRPKTVYYGHAKTTKLGKSDIKAQEHTDVDVYTLVKKIMKLTDKGLTAEAIQVKTGAGLGFITDVRRMYVTHQNVGVQGILDRVEIKGK